MCADAGLTQPCVTFVVSQTAKKQIPALAAELAEVQVLLDPGQRPGVARADVPLQDGQRFQML